MRLDSRVKARRCAPGGRLEVDPRFLRNVLEPIVRVDRVAPEKDVFEEMGEQRSRMSAAKEEER